MSGVPLPASPAWQVGPSIERRKSTLFPLWAPTADGTHVPAYYKVYRPRGAPGSAQQTRLEEALARMSRLDARFHRLAEGRPITAARVLDVDPERLTLVTLGLDGPPLGRAWRCAAPGGERENARRRYRLVGESIHLIERCADAQMPSSEDFLERKTELSVRRARKVLTPREHRSFCAYLDDLRSAAARECPTSVYAHNDVSRTNVLRQGQGVGLIDVSWMPALPGYDVACFMVRVEYESLWRTRWATAAIAELLQGYGDPDLLSGSAMRFAWVHRTMAVASRNASWGGRRRGARALAALGRAMRDG